MGRKLALVFGLAGLLLAGGLVAVLGATSILTDYPGAVTTGALGTLATSWWLGGRVQPTLADAGLLRALCLGAGVGIAALQTGIIFGSIPQLFGEANFQQWGIAVELRDYVVKPLYWINLFGLVPATLMGACFGVVVAANATQPDRLRDPRG